MDFQYPMHCFGMVPDEKIKGKLSLQQISIPKPKENELLVKVYAAGVNKADLDQAKGVYPPPAGMPNTLGLELSGVVLDKGSHVKNFKLNDRVMALVSAGAYAEYAIVPEETTMPIPDSLSFEEAAAIPEAYYTIWHNLIRKGNLQENEVFLVHGGASGVGSAAIQIAKSTGAIVIATVSSNEKKTACLNLGANLVINYKEEPFVEKIAEFTQGTGIDVILDWVGADYLVNHLKLLKNNGRLLCIDSQNVSAELDFDLLLGKSLTVTGTLLRPLPLKEKQALTIEIASKLLPKLATKQIKPLIYCIIPLEEAQSAHQILAESTHIGKVVLSVNSKK